MQPIVDDIIKNYDQLVNCFKFAKTRLDGEKKYQITIKEWKPKRSLAQNSLMWLWNQEIAKHVNEHGISGDNQAGAEDIHEYLVKLFWGNTATELFGEVHYSRIETKKFRVKQMAEHLEKMEYWTGEQDIPLTPTVNYELAMGR